MSSEKQECLTLFIPALNPHFQSCVIDGVFDKEGKFYPVDTLSIDEIFSLLHRVGLGVFRFKAIVRRFLANFHPKNRKKELKRRNRMPPSPGQGQPQQADMPAFDLLFCESAFHGSCPFGLGILSRTSNLGWTIFRGSGQWCRNYANRLFYTQRNRGAAIPPSHK